jgi:hypothetical protein
MMKAKLCSRISAPGTVSLAVTQKDELRTVAECKREFQLAQCTLYFAPMIKLSKIGNQCPYCHTDAHLKWLQDDARECRKCGASAEKISVFSWVWKAGQNGAKRKSLLNFLSRAA